MTLKRGSHLYRAGDRFEAVFVIKTGLFMTEIPIDDGRHQVTGFQMPAEILGLDGIGGDAHTWDVVALQDSVVCTIRFADLVDLSIELPALQRQLHKVMSGEIIRNHGVMLFLGTMTAEEKVAKFLLNLSQRFAACGQSSTEFRLSMTQTEIGSYLGLKFETVSRVFSQFNDEGLIAARQKNIRLVEVARLMQRAH